MQYLCSKLQAHQTHEKNIMRIIFLNCTNLTSIIKRFQIENGIENEKK